MIIFNKINRVLLIVFILFSFISTVEVFSKENDSNTPIEITADKMTSNQKQGRITFTGNVVAKRVNLTIFSDKMTVYNGRESKKLEKIIAHGHVKIEKEERFALGNHAVYIEKEEKIILTGNPRAWENDNEIVATEMIFLISEDKFVVKGTKEKKIKLTLYPDQENSEKE